MIISAKLNEAKQVVAETFLEMRVEAMAHNPNHERLAELESEIERTLDNLKLEVMGIVTDKVDETLAKQPV